MNDIMYNTKRLDKNRDRVVVFYGRVSTEHEAQLSALENQLQWYEDQARYHPNWKIKDRYIDEGITGTQAKKRPSFLRMIEDAKEGKFDLIVTREVCRFARNTVDTLTYTRELRELGIEVFFVEDNIWTLDNDGEMRLSLMATLAQDESRKISERVRAGQHISRQNGVLYGNGNILGYERNGSTYVINEEQAETVRIIYDLYLKGYGTKKIVNELYYLGRKASSGTVKWSVPIVNRILRNATYKGCICYNKSSTNNYLDQKRRMNYDTETYIYQKGDFEPIISEEIWDECQKIMDSRSVVIKDLMGNTKKYGSPVSKDKWIPKLICRCGSKFKRYKWRTNKKDALDVYGYSCYHRCRSASPRYLKSHNIECEDMCDLRGICDWKLEMMADKILGETLADKSDVIEEVISVINKCSSTESNSMQKNTYLENKIEKLENKLKRLIDMYAEGDIDKNEYRAARDETDKQLANLKAELEETEGNVNLTGNLINTEHIRKSLEEILDHSKDNVNDGLVKKFVSQINRIDDTSFEWIINLDNERTDKVICELTGRKNKAELTICDSEDCHFTYWVLNLLNISEEIVINTHASTILHRLLLHLSKLNHISESMGRYNH